MPLRDNSRRNKSSEPREIDFWHQVDQKARLRRIMRRILVDAEKTHQAVDQVIERGTEIGRAVVVALRRQRSRQSR